jgi:hypothetical protein
MYTETTGYISINDIDDLEKIKKILSYKCLIFDEVENYTIETHVDPSIVIFLKDYINDDEKNTLLNKCDNVCFYID